MAALLEAARVIVKPAMTDESPSALCSENPPPVSWQSMTTLDGPLTDWRVMDLLRKSRFVLPVPEYTPLSTSTVSWSGAATFRASWMWPKGCAAVPLACRSFVFAALTYQIGDENIPMLLKNTSHAPLLTPLTQALKFHTCTRETA